MLKFKDPRYFLLEKVLTEDDKFITGSRLPTYKQVLFYYLAHATTQKAREAANATVQPVLEFYEKARIPHLSHS